MRHLFYFGEEQRKNDNGMIEKLDLLDHEIKVKQMPHAIAITIVFHLHTRTNNLTWAIHKICT